MKVNVITHADGFKYLCLSDFAKEFEKKYKKKFNLSQSIKNIPDKYLIVTRGRNGITHINMCVLDIFFNSKRNIPSEFVEDLYKSLKINFDYKSNSMESFFIDLVSQFINNMIPNLSLKRQKTIENKSFDLCINDKILIEFDEFNHKYEVNNDCIKNEIAINNNYILIRVKSNSNYGIELSRIYKQVKKIV